jgi:hypothetical protein
MNLALDWPPDLVEAFRKKSDEFWKDPKNEKAYENPDDFRVARIGYLREELAFRKIEERGCCGSFETEWELLGTKVRYGFNYGH